MSNLRDTKLGYVEPQLYIRLGKFFYNKAYNYADAQITAVTMATCPLIDAHTTKCSKFALLFYQLTGWIKAWFIHSIIQHIIICMQLLYWARVIFSLVQVKYKFVQLRAQDSDVEPIVPE